MLDELVFILLVIDELIRTSKCLLYFWLDELDILMSNVRWIRYIKFRYMRFDHLIKILLYMALANLFLIRKLIEVIYFW